MAVIARGDSAARGALLAGGSCIGVLGTAIDSERGSLARDVESVGALVSEYPPGTPGRAGFFRARNRVTSGLSVGTVVVEAPEISGALLFAAEAADQGREVFAIPVNADAVSGRGTLSLLKEGAKPVTCGWDVLFEFKELFRDRVREPGREGVSVPKQQEEMIVAEAEKTAAAQREDGRDFVKLREPNPQKVVDIQKPGEYIDLKKQLEGLNENQLKIVSVMTTPSMHVDDIIEKSEIGAALALAELTMLQIKGFVRPEAGKRFTLNIKQK